ncbi:hypothetical protein C7M51_04327 [Mixta intestinalis]|uniref:Uncharacterized protein n=1 Tax=Mixta intestinalis TaxID=1615494 RepID=A0A6P1Q4R3_9GAMM|nr:hypothetical protein C7M51_04327 [Mixta intestinalis]
MARFGIPESQAKKTGLWPVLSKLINKGRLSHFADLCRQVSFMACSFVFVDQTFSSLTVHDRLHFVKCFLCSFFIASFNCCVYFLDESTHHGTTACVMLATFLRCYGAFLS